MKQSIFKSIKKILLLGPHPDDLEFSSGGTISRMVSEGADVHYAVFSMCEKSVPAGHSSDVIKKELIKASEFMGIKKKNLYLYDYEVRCFPEKRQEILEDMVKLNKMIKPELVLLPGSNDIHQDHRTISEEGMRAFKYSMIIGYEMPWNNFSAIHNLYISLSDKDMKKKTDTLKFYKSQDFRSYNNKDLIESLARVRGMQIKEKYAEAFEVIRLMFN